MAYETYRVEVTRDETVPEGGVASRSPPISTVMPETHDYTVGMLSRAPRGVWNSRLLFAGDFATLGEALDAIGAAFPETDRIGCYEYSVDNEFPVPVAPLVRSGGKWRPGRLSSPYGNVRGMRLSLVVETGDSVVDRAFESIGIGDGAIGQIMLLEVAPASFDIVQFGGVFRQPFEGEPIALGERAL